MKESSEASETLVSSSWSALDLVVDPSPYHGKIMNFSQRLGINTVWLVHVIYHQRLGLKVISFGQSMGLYNDDAF